ncbi:hypothetical protein SEPCBS119000_001056 [Sporothrix epigloea]|uniref:Carboxylesterase type B domain-containing protein n=1 Tax=Sporothrix epigloea TaxID=1892477 RepID=A0ABP0D8M6_9PEZI
MADSAMVPPPAESIRLGPMNRGDSEDSSAKQAHRDLDLDSIFGDENEPLQGDAAPGRNCTQRLARDRPRDGPRPRSESPPPASLRRRRLRSGCWSLVGILVGLLVVLAVISSAVASAMIYWTKPKAKGDAGPVDNISDGPFVDLGYATYVGQALSVYPPSDDGGSSHNRSAAPVAIHRYLGMRYAAPPVGDLRWRPPARPHQELDLQKATNFRSICIGLEATPRPGSGQDEDCLFVNVWGPANVVENTTSLPVWVFVQGGGYNSNSNADIDGADVVARSNGSIVFVNFNYRVGLYGFLSVPTDGTTTSLPPEISANFGLLDQLALLEWVQQHIHRFGGNPRHVVVHGGSAGAGSVVLHAIAGGGRGNSLFAGMVSESLYVPALPQCKDVAYKFWRAVDAVCYKSSKETWSVATALACLRRQTLSVLQDLVNVDHPLQYDGQDRPGKPLYYWGPCMDGTLFAERPSSAFQQGRFVHVPMMYGVATDEGTLFVPNAASQEEVVQFVLDNFPALAADDRGAEAVRQYYPLLPPLPKHNDWFPTLARVFGELSFVCPTINILDAVAAVPGDKDSTLYAYRYAMEDPDTVAAGLGTVHMMDGAAIFGPGNLACCPPASYTADDGDDGDDGAEHTDDARNGNPGLVPVMMDYYLSFVRTLNPNTFKSAQAAEWKTWDKSSRSRLVITSGHQQAMETVPEDLLERCRVWLDLADWTEQ